MHVNPKFANTQFLYANGDTASALPEGTYSNLAAAKYIKGNDKNQDKTLARDEVTLSKEAFDKLDKDKNGKIDLKEMKAALKGQDAAIEAYYKNKKPGSGKDDPTSSLLGNKTDQLKDMYTSLAATKYIKENDKNKDSSLSKDEVTLSKEAFERLDTDKDGKLELDEAKAALKGQEDAVAAYYETNGTSSSITNTLAALLSNPKDSKTGGTHSTRAAASYVASLDKDRDNSLSRAETALSAASFDKLDTDKNGTLSASEVQAAIKAKEDAYGIYYKNKVSSRTIDGLTTSLLKTI
jgi:Ca2+-binding EF-hand superfamily protein